MLMEEPINAMDRPLALRWISALFARELTPEEVQSYRTGQGRVLVDELAAAFPDAEELEHIRTILDSPEPPLDAALDLAGAFSWLFHGVGGPKAVPPHQHDWSEMSDGTQMECIDHCTKLMARCGLGPSQESGEPADHISTLLEFMGYLEQQSTTDPEGPWNGYREELIRNHLSPWLPHFLTACERNDRSGLYAALAGLTRRILPDISLKQ